MLIRWNFAGLLIRIVIGSFPFFAKGKNLVWKRGTPSRDVTSITRTSPLQVSPRPTSTWKWGYLPLDVLSLAESWSRCNALWSASVRAQGTLVLPEAGDNARRMSAKYTYFWPTSITMPTALNMEPLKWEKSPLSSKIQTLINKTGCTVLQFLLVTQHKLRRNKDQVSLRGKPHRRVCLDTCFKWASFSFSLFTNCSFASCEENDENNSTRTRAMARRNNPLLANKN